MTENESYFFLHHGATAQNTPTQSSIAAGVVYSAGMEVSPFRFIISIPFAIATIPAMTKRIPNPVSIHLYFPFFPAGREIGSPQWGQLSAAEETD